MTQAQGYYVMACVMRFCMFVENVEGPCEMSLLTQL